MTPSGSAHRKASTLDAVRMWIAWLVLITVAMASSACDVIVFAPTGSTISLSSIEQADGTLLIVALVTEPAGTAPHRGTRVFFSTTLGAIDAWADTDDNGQAVAIFFPGSSPGTATISASSGSVATGTTGALKITVT